MALNQNEMYLARSLNLVLHWICGFFSLNNAWLREYCNPMVVPELEQKDTTNTTSSASYLELHPEKLIVRVVWERNYLTKEMVPQDLSLDFPYAYFFLYFVVSCITIRLHQSNHAHSTTCLTFLICKYQDPNFIPWCNLQNTNVQCFVLYIFCDFRWEVIMDRNLNRGQ